MIETITWWSAAQLVGLIAFPLTFALFHRLPDRGYTFSKPLGLVLLGYFLWMGATLGVFPNSRGSVILILLALALAAVIVAGRRRDELRDFVRERWPYILFIEGLFAVALIVPAYIRSYIAEIANVEKPMDFAFLNAILRADQFPPQDPWLAGHAVPLYHFGHIMVASLTELTGLRSSVTLNLGVALIGAMAAIAVFGLVYNLLIVRGRPGSAIVFGLVAVGLLLILANIEGMFELLSRYGIGSRGFYGLVGIDGLNGPVDCKTTPGDCTEWYPTQWWYWWRATRIATQWDWREFPFFTFMLGELHAHLLSIPFVLTAMGIALNTLRCQEPLAAQVWPGVPAELRRLRDRFNGTPAGGSAGLILTSVTSAPPRLASATAGSTLDLAASAWEGLTFWAAYPARFIAISILLGALGFINLWDLPTFWALMVAMAGVRNYLSEGRLNTTVVGQTAGFAMPPLILSLLLYLPFYVHSFNPWGTHPVGGGILPIQLASIKGWPPIETMATRPQHFLYMWLTILWPTVSFAVAALGPWREHKGIFWWALLPAFVPFGLWLLLVTVHQGPSGLVDEAQLRGPWWITLAFLLAAISVAVLSFGRFLTARAKEDEGQQSLLFALAVGGIAIIILLGTELYWVQDPVGVRSNTVFRLNYQSWIMLSVSGAFGLHYIVSRWKPMDVLATTPRLLWVTLTFAIIGAGLVYPVIATPNRTFGFRTHQYLDGLTALRPVSPPEYEAIRWLSDNVKGTPIILEAVGGDYSDYGRVSSRTGLPTLLGWPDHEYRWRASLEVQGTRKQDVEQAYKTTSADEARDILEKYGVEYVYVGRLEKEAYGEAGLAKFASFMEVAYQNEGVTIYRLPAEGEIVVAAP